MINQLMTINRLESNKKKYSFEFMWTMKKVRWVIRLNWYDKNAYINFFSYKVEYS